MITVTIYALTLPPSPLFQRIFSRPMEADDYEAMFRKLGHCHIRRSTQ